jgi:hypothetical protein
LGKTQECRAVPVLMDLFDKARDIHIVAAAVRAFRETVFSDEEQPIRKIIDDPK